MGRVRALRKAARVFWGARLYPLRWATRCTWLIIKLLLSVVHILLSRAYIISRVVGCGAVAKFFLNEPEPPLLVGAGADERKGGDALCYASPSSCCSLVSLTCKKVYAPRWDTWQGKQGRLLLYSMEKEREVFAKWH